MAKDENCQVVLMTDLENHDVSCPPPAYADRDEPSPADLQHEQNDDDEDDDYGSVAWKPLWVLYRNPWGFRRWGAYGRRPFRVMFDESWMGKPIQSVTIAEAHDCMSRRMKVWCYRFTFTFQGEPLDPTILLKDMPRYGMSETNYVTVTPYLWPWDELPGILRPRLIQVLEKLHGFTNVIKRQH